MNLKHNLKEGYSPLYFLASLGAGGLSVSFFMYLMFMIKHPKTPMSTYSDIFPILSEVTVVSFLVLVALLGILFFAFVHFKLLIWNIKEYSLFKNTSSYTDLKNSNNEVQLMAMPLTMAMSINVCFILGAVFVPGLWSIVEYLFPFATIAFLLVGLYALKLYGSYVSRVLIGGTFDFEKNSNFSQMLAVFAFSMISVGLAAPGAMSHYVGVSAFALFFSILFMMISIILLVITLVIGFKSMLRYGVSGESAGTLWMLIPILTLLGIALVRISFGLIHNFQQEASPSYLFMLTSAILSAQIIVGFFGYMIMKKIGYFSKFVKSNVKSVGALGLICPGVAFFVFGMFFIFFGLLKNNVVEIFSLGYFIVLAPLVLIQLKTIQVFFNLSKKLLISKS
ncbi:TsoY family (seleno)protein [Sulfurospirillum arcachonense]|uniref:TsoY family (seleno)protein n=1 Tax=Sulfurospirillum arcachonense TaxID=57666 RepID=UPI000469FD95|nr:hypothetical protein [Sulfurospirillum arcachonense]